VSTMYIPFETRIEMRAKYCTCLFALGSGRHEWKAQKRENQPELASLLLLPIMNDCLSSFPYDNDKIRASQKIYFSTRSIRAQNIEANSSEPVTNNDSSALRGTIVSTSSKHHRNPTK